MILYIDKSQTIDCTLVVSGGDSVNNSQLRLILSKDGENRYYIGEAKTNSHEWSIRIPSLKDMQECECDMSVEVILDQYYFLVHNEKVTIKRSKPVVDFKMSAKEEPVQKPTVNKNETETPKIKFSIKYDEDVAEKFTPPIKEGVETINEKSEEIKKETPKEKQKDSVILTFDEFMENV